MDIARLNEAALEATIQFLNRPPQVGHIGRVVDPQQVEGNLDDPAPRQHVDVEWRPVWMADPRYHHVMRAVEPDNPPEPEGRPDDDNGPPA